MLNIFLPLSGKKKTIQSIQFGSRFVAREASQVGNARSLGHAESKRGPVNTKSGLVMDRRAKDSDGLLCVRVCVCRAASSSSASAYPSTATDRPHTGLLCHLLQQFHCCYHFTLSSGCFLGNSTYCTYSKSHRLNEKKEKNVSGCPCFLLT